MSVEALSCKSRTKKFILIINYRNDFKCVLKYKAEIKHWSLIKKSILSGASSTGAVGERIVLQPELKLG